ncbi:MAG: Segregation and condensation protein B, partial [uncultured Propionibacteriaceae bacterium]
GGSAVPAVAGGPGDAGGRRVPAADLTGPDLCGSWGQCRRRDPYLA